ncbi:PspC domain-containing protein [Actinocorallia sp. B10E7]|uniref:PspC domain-containing protein n=1 Tax=Actinocorallia sp. B10E7 TaxID=3153558 RepID=UPI00325D7E49
MTATLHRKMDNKMLAGVCSAIAAQTNLDLNIVRLAVAGVSVIGGIIGIGLAVPLLYVLAWILIPADDSDQSPAQRWFNKPEVKDAIDKASDALKKKP